MMTSEELTTAIARIKQMEEYLDQVQNALSCNLKSLLASESLKEAITILSEYYDSGQWLKDYESDENGVFPPDLKRGVLAQDTLYNLFQDLKEFSLFCQIV